MERRIECGGEYRRSPPDFTRTVEWAVPRFAATTGADRPMSKDPIESQLTDAFPTSSKMHADLARFLSSEESMKMSVSEVEALVWTRGKELLDKMKEEAFAMLVKAKGEKSEQVAHQDDSHDR